MNKRKPEPSHRFSRVTTRQVGGNKCQPADGIKQSKSDAAFDTIGDVDEPNS